ncbi:MAG: zinc ribbon domain-containing protein [Bacteroidia bacterium]|nr:zinc ribbon domain-containing protein [Bacteroidia bacterium]
METNCPKCQAPATNQSNYCFNCGLLLNQNIKAESSGTESKYKKVLVIVGLFVLCSTAFVLFTEILGDLLGFGIRRMTRPISWLISVGTAGIPLVISLVLQKNVPVKKLLFIAGIIVVALKFISIFWSVLFGHRLGHSMAGFF